MVAPFFLVADNLPHRPAIVTIPAAAARVRTSGGVFARRGNHCAATTTEPSRRGIRPGTTASRSTETGRNQAERQHHREGREGGGHFSTADVRFGEIHFFLASFCGGKGPVTRYATHAAGRGFAKKQSPDQAFFADRANFPRNHGRLDRPPFWRNKGITARGPAELGWAPPRNGR